MRLGEYEEQLRWNATARAFGPSSGYQQVQTAYHRAFGLAMLGNSADAVQAFDSASGGVPPVGAAWLVQAWKLHRSDILLLCGHQKAAASQARDAVELPVPVLHAPSLAGAFARWLALASEPGESNAVQRMLEDLSLRLFQFDTLDRVEVICARLSIGDGDPSGLQESLRSYVAGLPPASVSQLQRLGVFRMYH
jgi:hypothetical protein